MTKERVIAIGGPIGGTPGSQARRCKTCGELAYFSPETFKRLATERPGEKPVFLCLNCVPPDDTIKVMPFNKQQVADIHALGFDMTSDQLNEFARTGLLKYARRKR